MSEIRVDRLSCGCMVLCEQMSGVRSAAVTGMVPGGSAYDPLEEQGRATLWSELLLRGTKAHSSRVHADMFDRLGVSRSADAGSYYMKVGAALLGTQMRPALDMLMQMVLSPLMEDAAIGPCQELALAAIESMKDDPQERAAHLARARHYAAPLDRSGLGTPEGIMAVSGASLREAWPTVAVPGGANRSGSMFGFAGDIDAGQIVEQMEAITSGWRGDTREPELLGQPVRGYDHAEDPSNQVQILVLHDAPAESNPDSMLEKVVVNVLSGGMAGRLFTQVREKRGLCYSVSAGYRGERDFGSVSAYVGTTPEKAQQSIDVLFEQLHLLSTAEGRVTREEFDRAITGMKTGVVFSGESSAARAASIVSDYRRLGTPRTLEQVAREVAAVTLDQVNEYLSRRSMGRVTIQTLGPAPLVSPI